MKHGKGSGYGTTGQRHRELVYMNRGVWKQAPLFLRLSHWYGHPLNYPYDVRKVRY